MSLAEELDQLAQQRADDHLERKQRTARLRAELAACRKAGLEARHRARLRREAALRAAAEEPS